MLFRSKVSQDRVSQLEAQLKEAPNPNDLASTQQQADAVRAQLTQATEQIKVSQDRVSQLEAQLKEAPNPNDLASTQQQPNKAFGQTTEQFGASEGRVGRLEAQLNQAPNLTQQEGKNISPVRSVTPPCEAISCSVALSPRSDPGTVRR